MCKQLSSKSCFLSLPIAVATIAFLMSKKSINYPHGIKHIWSLVMSAMHNKVQGMQLREKEVGWMGTQKVGKSVKYTGVLTPHRGGVQWLCRNTDMGTMKWWYLCVF